MNDRFTLLDCDDVILLGKDTFKVSRLKELVEKQLRSKLQRRIHETNTLEPGISMLEFFSQISLGDKSVNLMEIQHNYLTDCQVLRIGGRGWERGKLKVKISISTINAHQKQIDLEFCSYEPEYDSLLDEICKIVAET